jgi:hypothetical protein
MIDVYVEKGITVEDAREIVELLWPHQNAFLGRQHWFLCLCSLFSVSIFCLCLCLCSLSTLLCLSFLSSLISLCFSRFFVFFPCQPDIQTS